MPEHRSGRACSRNRSVVAPAGVPEHRSGHACSRNRSVVAPAGVPEHRSKHGYPRNRSAEAPTGHPLIHFSNLGSHMIICLSKLNLSLLPSVFMTYCFSCSCSCFSSFSYFIYLYRNTNVFTYHSCIIVPRCIYFS